jgi:hypothetical protein
MQLMQNCMSITVYVDYGHVGYSYGPCSLANQPALQADQYNWSVGLLIHDTIMHS